MQIELQPGLSRGETPKSVDPDAFEIDRVSSDPRRGELGDEDHVDLEAWGRVRDLPAFDGLSLAPEAVSFQMPMISIPSSWQRPASSASGGHRSDQRSIPSNAAPISIPIELFLQNRPEAHPAVGRVLVYLQGTSKGTSMPRRELLSKPQRLAFTEPVTDERAMVRHYILSAEDLALIDRRCGDPN